MRIKKGK